MPSFLGIGLGTAGGLPSQCRSGFGNVGCAFVGCTSDLFSVGAKVVGLAPCSSFLFEHVVALGVRRVSLWVAFALSQQVVGLLGNGLPLFGTYVHCLRELLDLFGLEAGDPFGSSGVVGLGLALCCAHMACVAFCQALTANPGSLGRDTDLELAVFDGFHGW